MLKLSWNTPLVCCWAAAFHASSFDLLCFCFLKCAVSFCCCGVFSFDLCFCVLPCVTCFISFSGGGFFLMCQRFLGISFFELGHFKYPIVSCFSFLFLVWMSFPNMVIKKVAMTYLWSLPMWIMSLASACLNFSWSKCSQFVFFSFWRNEGRLFLRSLPEHRIESGVII